MCFRSNEVHINGQIQIGYCPSCGMEVAAPLGVTSGDCPYCGEPIPPETSDSPLVDPEKNARIL